MDFARNRLHLGLIFLINVFFVIPVYGDWNADFFENSRLLFESIGSFQKTDVQYESNLQKFQEFRDEVEANQVLTQELMNLKKKDKYNFFSDTFVLKKRPKDNINELFFWELSIIFSLNEYATPSFPFDLANTHIYIVQPIENFRIGNWIETPPLSVIRWVDLRNYFRAHILAFILGADDLSGMNIGVTPQKNIRFFDNENLFIWDLSPRKTDKSFYVQFVSVAFDWPQYRKKLNLQLAAELRQFVAGLEKKKEDLLLYSKIRNLPEDVVSGIFERIDLLQAFDFTAGVTLKDFVHFLYPRLSEGLAELNAIVSRILHRNVDHGISLFFATRMIKFWNVPESSQKALDFWIERYVL